MLSNCLKKKINGTKIDVKIYIWNEKSSFDVKIHTCRFIR